MNIDPIIIEKVFFGSACIGFKTFNLYKELILIYLFSYEFYENENYGRENIILLCFDSPPDDNSSMSGLKFSFEPQSNSYTTPSMTPQPDIKESPPSSPGSEAGSKKRSSAIHDTKDYRMHSKSVTATHMLGNQLNPASSVAQKMTDQLYMEIEEHSAYTSSSLDSGTQLIGPTFPGKHLNNVSGCS